MPILNLMVVGLVYQRDLAEGLEKLLLDFLPAFYRSVHKRKFNSILFLTSLEGLCSEHSMNKREYLILANVMQEICLILDQRLKQLGNELRAVLLHHQLVPELPIVKLALHGLLREENIDESDYTVDRLPLPQLTKNLVKAVLHQQGVVGTKLCPGPRAQVEQQVCVVRDLVHIMC
jgi:hypothetical protein